MLKEVLSRHASFGFATGRRLHGLVYLTTGFLGKLCCVRRFFPSHFAAGNPF